MVGGKSGSLVNNLVASRRIASSRIRMPSGRWIVTSVWYSPNEATMDTPMNSIARRHAAISQ